MNCEMARSQAESLLDWAREWEHSEIDGRGEVVFLLRRVAIKIAKASNIVNCIPVKVEEDDAAPSWDDTEQLDLRIG